MVIRNGSDEMAAKPTFDNLPEEKRARIVKAVIEEFAAHPYVSASTNRIVKAAGISKGSMYQYFENKIAVFRWLVWEHAAQVKGAYVGPADVAAAMADGDLLGFLRHGIRAGIEFTLDHPKLARAALRLMEGSGDAELAQVKEEHFRMGERMMRAFVESAQAAGRVDAALDPELVTPLIAHATGPMLVDALLVKMGTTLDGFLNRPEEWERPDAAQIDALVDGLMRILERGLAPKRAV
jgi:AcrR family transcriptional regulator